MSARIKITSPCTKDINRSDSPGYFTLSSNSDSDIGDGSGDISGEDEDFLQPKQQDTTLSQSRNDDNFAGSLKTIPRTTQQGRSHGLKFALDMYTADFNMYSFCNCY